MRRRDFLGMGLAAGASMLLPQRSAAGSSTGPLLIHIQAGGGWDPTLLCDPRPELSSFTFGVGERSTPNGLLRFADLGGSGTPIPRDIGYRFADFFASWGEQTLVLNGIYTHGVGHRSGGRYAASGRISAGYPALAALTAAVAGADLAMPLIISADSGYAETRGHVAPTRLSNSQFLDELAWPNVYANGSANYYLSAENQALASARETRLARLIGAEQRSAEREVMQKLQAARSHQDDLSLLVTAMADGPNITLPTQTNNNRTARRIFSDGFASMLAYEQGLCQAAILQGGSFDTHVDHDTSHPNQLQCLLLALDLLMEEAQARSLPVLFLVTSEFGRTAGYNVANGKDHWPVTSWMMLQSPALALFVGGREIGATALDPGSGVTVYRDLDISDLTVGVPAGGAPLTPELIHVGLRTLLGIQADRLADHHYPLVGPDVSALFTG